MTHFMSWFKSLFSPRLRCWRRGFHKYEKCTDRRAVRGKFPSRDVLSIYDGTYLKCTTCRHVPKFGRDIKYVTGYQSVTMDKSDWDRLDRNGSISWE